MYIDIYLNQLAQDVFDFETAVKWFQELDVRLQNVILQKVVFFITQMKCNGIDIEDSLEINGIKKTYTPCVILSKFSGSVFSSNELKNALIGIINLPKDEKVKSFKALFFLFKVIYKKKYLLCKNQEKYWWFRDLSQDKNVDEVLIEFGCLPLKSIPKINKV